MVAASAAVAATLDIMLVSTFCECTTNGNGQILFYSQHQKRKPSKWKCAKCPATNEGGVVYMVSLNSVGRESLLQQSCASLSHSQQIAAIVS